MSVSASTNRKPVFIINGGAGYLGSHTGDRLIAEGHRVVAIDNFITGALENIAHHEGDSDFSLVEQDVSRFISCDEEVDYIFRFASAASPFDYLELPKQTLQVGSLGTHNALGLARAKGATRSFVTSASSLMDDSTVRQSNIGRAREVLGSEPRVPFEEGVIETIEYFQKNVHLESI